RSTWRIGSWTSGLRMSSPSRGAAARVPELPRREARPRRSGERAVELSAPAGPIERRDVPDLLRDDTDTADAGAAEPPPHREDEGVEDRLRAPRLGSLEDGHVDRPGRVVEREEDDALAAPYRRRLRGDLDARDHHPGVAPLPPEVPGADDVEVLHQALEERHQVAGAVDAEDLELRADALRVVVVAEGGLHRLVDGERELVALPRGFRGHRLEEPVPAAPGARLAPE